MTSLIKILVIIDTILIIFYILTKIPITLRTMVVLIGIVTDLEFWLMYKDIKGDIEYIKYGKELKND